MTANSDNARHIVAISWYLSIVIGCFLVLGSTYVLYRSYFVRQRRFYVLMCALIMLGTIFGGVGVRLELEIYKEIGTLPHPLNVREVTCISGGLTAECVS